MKSQNAVLKVGTVVDYDGRKLSVENIQKSGVLLRGTDNKTVIVPLKEAMKLVVYKV